jgi:4-hydroxybenzoate polyprenyltransferase
MLNLTFLVDSGLAFLVFCLLSGSIYLINDILDIEKDKNHPKKRKRPVPSGTLKVSHAIFFIVLFLTISFTVAYWVNQYFFLITLFFIILLLSYSLWFKNIIIADILIISSGFVIRAVAGALAISVFVSPWLIICAFLLALFLALGKRRHELIILGDEAKNHRIILEGYSTQMLDQMITITTSSLIMSYSLYTFFVGNIYMMITIPFAFYGLFKYLFLVHSKNLGGEPELIFKDKGMILSMILWVMIVFIVIYVDKIRGIF